MKYRCASILIAVFSFFFTAAATEIRLKNGTVYTGEIVGEDPQFYSMKTGNTTRAINKILIAEMDGNPYRPSGSSAEKEPQPEKTRSAAGNEKQTSDRTATVTGKSTAASDVWNITLTTGSVFIGKRISENARILVIESKGAPVSIFRNMIAVIDSGNTDGSVGSPPGNIDTAEIAGNRASRERSSGPAVVGQTSSGEMKTGVSVSTLVSEPVAPTPETVAPRKNAENRNDGKTESVNSESLFTEKKFTATRMEFGEKKAGSAVENRTAVEKKSEPQSMPNGLPVPRSRMTVVSFNADGKTGADDAAASTQMPEPEDAAEQPEPAQTSGAVKNTATAASVSGSIQVIPAPLPAFVQERKKAAKDAMRQSKKEVPAPSPVSSADNDSTHRPDASPPEPDKISLSEKPDTVSRETSVEVVPKLGVQVAIVNAPAVTQVAVATAGPSLPVQPAPLPMAQAASGSEPVKKRTDGKVEIVLDNGTHFIGTVKKEGPHSIAFVSDGAVISILKRLIREIDGEPYHYEKPDSGNAAAIASARRAHSTMKKQQLSKSQRVLFRIMPYIEIPRGLTAEALIDSMSRSTDWRERSTAARLLAAMGQWGVSAIPAAVALLDDTAQSAVPVPLTLDSLEAQHLLAPGLEAARALAQLGNQATNELLKAFRSDKPLRRRNAVFGFGNCFFDVAVKCVAEALSDQDADVRRTALSSLRVPDAQPYLVAACKDRSPEVRAAAVFLLGKTGNPDVLPVLGKMIHDKNSQVRSATARSLSMFGSVEQLAPMAQLCRDRDNLVRAVAVRSLKKFEDSAVVDLCLQATRDSSAEVRLGAVEALSVIKSSRAIPSLYSLVKDSNPLVRERAEAVLREHTDITLLIAALDSGSEFVRSNVAYILWLLTAQEFGPDKAKWEAWAATRQQSGKTDGNEVLVNRKR